MPTVRKASRIYERYDLSRSPLAQRPTQKEVASLLHETRDDLRRLIRYKEAFVVRRTIETGKKAKKTRQLAYPEGRLRIVHELLKFHLNKVRQPDYLFSPRKGRSQRDNAELHLGKDQFLTFDIKQFYPSTTELMVRRWLVEELRMYPDVARMLAQLATIDGVVSFGSPLTPVLCALVHRKMFDQIADMCDQRNLRYSIWVDDVTISGRFVTGELLTSLREIVRQYGLRTHKIKFQNGNRPVFVTGVGVLGRKLVTPRKIDDELKRLFEQYNEAKSLGEKEDCAQRLLSQLGVARFISGRASARGRRAADHMNSVRQQLASFRKTVNEAGIDTIDSRGNSETVPFEL